MHTASLARYLDSRGLVVFDAAGADCFLEKLPPEPVDAVAVYARQGPAGDLTPYVWLGAQVVVRSSGAGGDARAGYERALGIHDELNGLRHVTLAPGTADELRLIRCLALHDAPVSLDRDAEDRIRWSLLFSLYVVRPGTHSLPG